jgi:hypothetical protein
MNGAPMFTPRVGVELPSSLLYLGEAVMAGYPEVSIAWTRLFAELVGESKSSVTRDFWNLRFHCSVAFYRAGCRDDQDTIRRLVACTGRFWAEVYRGYLQGGHVHRFPAGLPATREYLEELFSRCSPPVVAWFFRGRPKTDAWHGLADRRVYMSLALRNPSPEVWSLVHSRAGNNALEWAVSVDHREEISLPALAYAEPFVRPGIRALIHSRLASPPT